MQQNADLFFTEGCLRCDKGRSADCKVVYWKSELLALRAIMQETELEETAKWGQPFYTLDGKNVAMIYAYKGNCGIAFMAGVLLSDPAGLLVAPGPNSQASRKFKFTDVDDVNVKADLIRAYIAEAIEIAKSGRKVEFKSNSELEFPDELLELFDEDPEFHDAFKALTPGRQRGYNLFFTGAKQSATRMARIEKHYGDIMEGLGIHDRYRQGLK